MPEVRRRAAEAYERALRDKVPVAVLCLSIENVAHPTLRTITAPAAWQLVARALVDLPRGGELFAHLVEDRLVAVLTSMPREAAELSAALLVDGARKLAVSGSDKPARASLSIGLAFHEGNSGYFLETLEKVAEESLAVALLRGGECTAHTELYGLYQKKLERERPALAAAAAAAATPAPVAPPPAREAPTKFSAERAAREKIERILAEEQRRRPQPAREEMTPEEVPVEQIDDVGEGDLLERLATTLSQKHRTEVEHLERRIAKLVRSLEQTEVELADMAQRKSVDGGVPSAYRRVQGLGAGEKDRALKLELLEQIAQANVELREKLRQPL
ncbi:MAG: hypothetical protein ACKVWV_06905 [Planctomycetota bacterium]